MREASAVTTSIESNLSRRSGRDFILEQLEALSGQKLDENSLLHLNLPSWGWIPYSSRKSLPM